MRKITVTSFGDAECLSVSDAADPMPKAGEVQITIEAAGVGLVDILKRQGRYPGLSEAGFVPGIEVAGVVTEIGVDTDPRWHGKRVFARVLAGGYAEKVIAPVTHLTHVPDGLSGAHAVSLGINALVAEFAFDQGGLKAGDHVLVRGAGGGIGVMAVQIAKMRAATVAAVTSSPERAERLKAMGAETIINRSAEPVATAETYDFIIDPVFGKETATYLAKLNPNGHHVVVGVAGGIPSPEFGMTLLMNFQKSLSLSTFSLDSIGDEAIDARLKSIFARAAAGVLKPIVDTELPLLEAANAHRKMEAGSFGKVVLVA